MKLEFDRRQFLAGSAGALSMTLLPRSGRAVGPVVPPAPVARVDVVQDTYFGETLSDPYRWMENDKDPDWLPYLKAQNDHTRAVLDALPTRAQLLKRIQQLSGDTVATSRVQRAGGLTFFSQRPLGADNFKLFVREDGRDRVLIDPTAGGRSRPRVARLVARLARRHATWCTACRRTAAKIPCCIFSPSPTAASCPRRIGNTEARQSALAR